MQFVLVVEIGTSRGTVVRRSSLVVPCTRNVRRLPDHGVTLGTPLVDGTASGNVRRFLTYVAVVQRISYVNHVKCVPEITARRERASQRQTEFSGRRASLGDHREAAVAVGVYVHIAASGEELDRAARRVPRMGVEVVDPPRHISCLISVTRKVRVFRLAAVRDAVKLAVLDVETGLRITVTVVLKRGRSMVVERRARVI